MIAVVHCLIMSLMSTMERVVKVCVCVCIVCLCVHSVSAYTYMLFSPLECDCSGNADSCKYNETLGFGVCTGCKVIIVTICSYV